MLLAEANQWPADLRTYFGDGDEFHMAFHFPLMPRMFMGLKLNDRKPITEILAADSGDSWNSWPMVLVPPQPRRVDARNGDGPGTRLHV